MVFYMAPRESFEKAMKESTPEKQKEGMEEWKKWLTSNAKSIVDEGGPLGKTKRADAKGVSDTTNGIGGYSIVQADSGDDAAKLFDKSHPHLRMMPDAWVEVTEIMPSM